MTPEEELNDLRQRFKDGVKRGIEEKRATTVSMGIISVTALVALVYGFFQQTSAKKEQIVAQVSRIIFDKEIVVLRKQILLLKEENLVEVEKSKTCEKALADLQTSKSKPVK